MFLDNLPISVLRLCEVYGLTYEAAAERCRISSRYFGDIARGKTAPSILTLEKICKGFHTMPNDLLMTEAAQRKMTVQKPLPVITIHCRCCPDDLVGFPACPQCGILLDVHQPACGRCGQSLSWRTGESVVF